MVAAIYTALLVWVPRHPPLAVCDRQPYGEDGMLISLCNRGWMSSTLSHLSPDDSPLAQQGLLVSQQALTPTDIEGQLATTEGLRPVPGARVRPNRTGEQYTLYIRWAQGPKTEVALHYRFFGVPLRLTLPGVSL